MPLLSRLQKFLLVGPKGHLLHQGIKKCIGEGKTNILKSFMVAVLYRLEMMVADAIIKSGSLLSLPDG